MSEKKLPNARAAYRDSIRGLSKLIDSKIRGAISLGNTRIFLQRKDVPSYIVTKLEKAGYKVEIGRRTTKGDLVVIISWEIESDE